MLTQETKSNAHSAAEYFASMVRKPHQGSLKVYVGRVQVGKLFDTLVREGKQLAAIGLDVVVALDEKNIKANFPHSKTIPAREIKETHYMEADCDEIQRRSPDVVVIDDLLHCNLTEGGQDFRYKNVKHFLSHGMNVIASIYSAWDNNLKSVLCFLASGSSVPVERWAELPKDEVVALVFTPKETFSHAELVSTN